MCGAILYFGTGLAVWEGMTTLAGERTMKAMKIEEAVATVTGLTVEAAVDRVGDDAGAEVREIYNRDGVHVWEVVGCEDVKYLETPVGFQTTSDIETDFPEIASASPDWQMAAEMTRKHDDGEDMEGRLYNPEI